MSISNRPPQAAKKPERINPDDFPRNSTVASVMGLETLNKFFSYLVEVIKNPKSQPGLKDRAMTALLAINCCRFIKVNQDYIKYAFNNKENDKSLYTEENGGMPHVGDGTKNPDGSGKYVIRDFGCKAYIPNTDNRAHARIAIDLIDKKYTPKGYKDADELLEFFNTYVKTIEWLIDKASKNDKITLEEMAALFPNPTIGGNDGCIDARLGMAVAHATILKSQNESKEYVPNLDTELTRLQFSGDEAKDFQMVMEYCTTKQMFGKKVCYKISSNHAKKHAQEIEVILKEEIIIEYMVRVFGYDDPRNKPSAVQASVLPLHEEKMPTYTAAQALELLPKERALIKIVNTSWEEKPVAPGQLADDPMKSWTYLLNQFIDSKMTPQERMKVIEDARAPLLRELQKLSSRDTQRRLDIQQELNDIGLELRRPIKSLTAVNPNAKQNPSPIDRTLLWDPSANTYYKREVQQVRGAYNKQKEAADKEKYTWLKKDSFSLLPTNGLMEFFDWNGTYQYPVGLFFDLNACKFKKDQNGRDKYIWLQNAGSNRAPWIWGSTGEKIPWTTLPLLRENLRQHVKSKTVPKHNELKICVRIASFRAVFANKDELLHRLNALRIKHIIKAFLNIDVALLIITPYVDPYHKQNGGDGLCGAREYTKERQLADIKIALSDKNSEAYRLVKKISDDPLKFIQGDDSIQMKELRRQRLLALEGYYYNNHANGLDEFSHLYYSHFNGSDRAILIPFLSDAFKNQKIEWIILFVKLGVGLETVINQLTLFEWAVEWNLKDDELEGLLKASRKPVSPAIIFDGINRALTKGMTHTRCACTIVKTIKIDVNYRSKNDNGLSLLHRAIQQNNTKMVEELLAQQASLVLEAENPTREIPIGLIWNAAQPYKARMIALVTQHLQSMDDKSIETVLTEAAVAKEEELCMDILQFYPHIPLREFNYILLLAIKRHDPALAARAVTAGASPDYYESKQNDTPMLILARETWPHEKVLFANLLAKASVVTLISAYGKWPHENDIKIAICNKLLMNPSKENLEKGIHLLSVDDLNRLLAATNKNPNFIMIRNLILKESIRRKDDANAMALMERLLSQAGENVFFKENKDDSSAFEIAVDTGNAMVAGFIISICQDPTKAKEGIEYILKNAREHTAPLLIHIATESPNQVEKILPLMADADQINTLKLIKLGWYHPTFLYREVQKGRIIYIHDLLKHATQDQLMHAAAQGIIHGQTGIVLTILPHINEINKVFYNFPSKKVALIHLAVSYLNIIVLEVLLKKNAEVGLKTIENKPVSAVELAAALPEVDKLKLPILKTLLDHAKMPFDAKDLQLMLFHAIKHKDILLAARLVDEKKVPLTREIIFMMAEGSDCYVEVIKAVIKVRRKDDMLSCLSVAISKNNKYLTILLIQALRGEVNNPYNGLRFVNFAIQHHNIDILEVLCEYGAVLTEKSGSSSVSALEMIFALPTEPACIRYYACAWQYAQMAMTEQQKIKLLFVAIRAERIDLVQEIFFHSKSNALESKSMPVGPLVDAIDEKNQQTIVYCAMMSGHVDIIATVLHQNPSGKILRKTIADFIKSYPAYQLLEKNKDPLLRLLNHPFIKRDDKQWIQLLSFTLCEAIKLKNNALIKALLGMGADPFYFDLDAKESPIGLALNAKPPLKPLEVISILVTECKNKEGVSTTELEVQTALNQALHEAINADQIPLAMSLLAFRAFPNPETMTIIMGNTNNNLKYFLVINKIIEVCSPPLLLSYLSAAILADNTEFALLLINALPVQTLNAPINGWRLVNQAIQHRRIEILTELCKKGASLTEKDNTINSQNGVDLIFDQMEAKVENSAYFLLAEKYAKEAISDEQKVKLLFVAIMVKETNLVKDICHSGQKSNSSENKSVSRENIVDKLDQSQETMVYCALMSEEPEILTAVLGLTPSEITLRKTINDLFLKEKTSDKLLQLLRHPLLAKDKVVLTRLLSLALCGAIKQNNIALVKALLPLKIDDKESFDPDRFYVDSVTQETPIGLALAVKFPLTPMGVVSTLLADCKEDKVPAHPQVKAALNQALDLAVSGALNGEVKEQKAGEKDQLAMKLLMLGADPNHESKDEEFENVDPRSIFGRVVDANKYSLIKSMLEVKEAKANPLPLQEKILKYVKENNKEALIQLCTLDINLNEVHDADGLYLVHHLVKQGNIALLTGLRGRLDFSKRTADGKNKTPIALAYEYKGENRYRLIRALDRLSVDPVVRNRENMFNDVNNKVYSLSSVKEECMRELKEYKDRREEERNNAWWGRERHLWGRFKSCFFHIPEAKDKIGFVDNAEKLINDPTAKVEFTEEELRASQDNHSLLFTSKDSRLRKVVKTCQLHGLLPSDADLLKMKKRPR